MAEAERDQWGRADAGRLAFQTARRQADFGLLHEPGKHKQWGALLVGKLGNAHGAKRATQASRSQSQPVVRGSEAVNCRMAAAILRRAGRRD